MQNVQNTVNRNNFRKPSVPTGVASTLLVGALLLSGPAVAGLGGALNAGADLSTRTELDAGSRLDGRIDSGVDARVDTRIDARVEASAEGMTRAEERRIGVDIDANERVDANVRLDAEKGLQEAKRRANASASTALMLAEDQSAQARADIEAGADSAIETSRQERRRAAAALNQAHQAAVEAEANAEVSGKADASGAANAEGKADSSTGS